MSDIKDQLIKLGAEKPALQRHIKPVLDTITRIASPDFDRAVANLVHYLNRGGRRAGGWEEDALNATGAHRYFDPRETARRGGIGNVFALTEGPHTVLIKWSDLSGEWYDADIRGPQ